MKVNISMHNTRSRRGCKFGERSGCEEKVWARCNKSGLVIPGVVCGDRVEFFAVNVARN